MIGPKCALIISDTKNDCRPGLCKIETGVGEEYGWYVYYTLNKWRYEGWDIYIKLLVEEKADNTSNIEEIKFLVDTGSPRTIIPRRLITRVGAFQYEKSEGAWEIEGISGRIIIGLQYSVFISIPSQKKNYPSLSFDKIKVLVSDDINLHYGILGLDAIRRIVIISDNEYVTFWRFPECD